MDDTPPSEESKKEFNKLDLSQLQDFSFGTQWSQDKTADKGARPGPAKFRDSRSDDRERPRREGGGGPGGPGGPDRRDRRTFRRPAGAPTGAAPSGEFRPGPTGPGGDRRDGPREDRRGGPGGGRPGGHPRGRERPAEHVPYVSPFYDVTFYPEDVSFEALAKTIRSSCRTFELFDIARTVIAKNDRFVVVVQPKPGARSGGEGAEPTPKPKFYLSIPDGLIFESEEAVVNHVMQNHLGVFFDAEEIEVDPPKGSFQVINKCGLTGALLGPPNYHRYNQMVQQHHAAHAARMSLDAYRSRIESVRDEEVVNQWLESQKKATKFTLKGTAAKNPAAAAPAEAKEEAPAPATSDDASAPVEGATDAPATETAEAPSNAISFNNLEDARLYLLTHARDKIVRVVETGRFHGKGLDQMPDSEIKRGVIGALERQRRFPLDTANALRGRLRREGFTIFKKGSKGVSYVCAVKRKFRVPGQTFAESIGELIDFIEAHPMIKASELPEKFLGLAPEARANPTGSAENVTPPGASITPDDQRRLSRMQGDLRWLVMEGYVTEFMDGSVFAAPPIPEPKSASAPGAEKASEATDAESDSADTDSDSEAEAVPPAAEVASDEAKADDERPKSE